MLGSGRSVNCNASNVNTVSNCTHVGSYYTVENVNSNGSSNDMYCNLCKIVDVGRASVTNKKKKREKRVSNDFVTGDIMANLTLDFKDPRLEERKVTLNSSVYIPCSIENGSEGLSLFALADTGAEANLVSSQTLLRLKDFNPDIKETDARVYGASMTQLPLLGRVDLNIKFGDKVFTLPFLVIGKMISDIVIGTPGLSKIKAKLSFADNTMTIDDDQVKTRVVPISDGNNRVHAVRGCVVKPGEHSVVFGKCPHKIPGKTTFIFENSKNRPYLCDLQVKTDHNGRIPIHVFNNTDEDLVISKGSFMGILMTERAIDTIKWAENVIETTGKKPKKKVTFSDTVSIRRFIPNEIMPAYQLPRNYAYHDCSNESHDQYGYLSKGCRKVNMKRDCDRDEGFTFVNSRKSSPQSLKCHAVKKTKSKHKPPKFSSQEHIEYKNLSDEQIIRQRINFENSVLNEEQKEEFLKIFIENRDALSLYGETGIGTPLYQAKVRGTSSATPFQMKPYMRVLIDFPTILWNHHLNLDEGVHR